MPNSQSRRLHICAGILLLLPLSAVVFGAFSRSSKPTSVLAARETDPLTSKGDVADDPCIWIHPIDPRQSVVVCTEKKRGLLVYDLQGKLIQELLGGEPNNIDNRAGLSLGGVLIDLFVAGDRKVNSLAFWTINSKTRQLSVFGHVELDPAFKVYGSCFYRSRKSDRLYVFVTSKEGAIEQWEIVLTVSEKSAAPLLKGTLVRKLKVATKAEGCVADDELGWLYVAEEKQGIWRFAAEPDDATQPVLVDSTQPKGNLVPDVEGLAIYRGVNGMGYLLASCQGADSFLVYQRLPKNDYVGQFKISEGPLIDTVSHTDGIEVTSANLDGPFAEGLFVAQDGADDVGNQNFKLVPWKRIAEALRPELNSREKARPVP